MDSFNHLSTHSPTHSFFYQASIQLFNIGCVERLSIILYYQLPFDYEKKDINFGTIFAYSMEHVTFNFLFRD